MFRRRGQRAQIPPRLQRANQLMLNGDYQNAEPAFLELAQGAEVRFPNRAPILFLEAGRAAILAGNADRGLGHIKNGLNLLRAQGRIPRMMALGQRAMEELRTHGLNSEAAEILEFIKEEDSLEAAQNARTSSSIILPTHCPSCGGAVRLNEVEWLDAITAECAYCGSPLRERS